MSLPTATTTGATTAAAAATTTAQQQLKNQQPQCYLNENQNCDNEDLDKTSSKSHLSFPCFTHFFRR